MKLNKVYQALDGHLIRGDNNYYENPHWDRPTKRWPQQLSRGARLIEVIYHSMLLIIVGRWFLAAKWRFGIFCLLKSLHYHPIITTPFFHPFPSYSSLNFSHLLKSQTPERENWINQPLMPVASITTWKPGSDFAWLLDCWDICRITVIYMQVVCYNLNITFVLKNWDSVGFWSKLFFGFGSDVVSRSQHSQ